ncbi:helix-turn-helix domain-containing protein [Streptosporangium sp. NPDC005286]|uniref:helix-turn-helix transcriptional regulator n=1 Tax=Streptosporangium sp. NPDC005286 TaxID=3154463 RepID=UPI0033B5EA75
MTRDDSLWGVAEASRFLRVPVATLYQWRHLGTGPESHKVGRHVRYLPEDVVAWVRRQP